jgi:hypothetical protein
VARDLAITTDELSSMLFGLTFTVVTGAGRDADPGGRSTPEQLGLQLL